MSNGSNDLRDYPTLQIGATRLPHPKGGKSGIRAGGWMMGVNPRSPHLQESQPFIRFFADTQSVKYIATKTDRAALPVRISVWPCIAVEAQRGGLKHLQELPYDVVLDTMQE